MLNNLSEREVLLLLVQKLEGMEARLKEYHDERMEMQVKIKEIETKLKFYAAGISAIVALASSVILQLIFQQ